MGNREERNYNKSVHLFMALTRHSHTDDKPKCIRSVCKGKDKELEIFEAKLKAIGGYWRIHKTVNARDAEKARILLLHKLIDYPDRAGCIDTEWRTALLQRYCIAYPQKWMLDIDLEDETTIKKIVAVIHNSDGVILERHKSPKGWHFITYPFDSRAVCAIDDVTLIRDGYYFIKEIGGE